MLAAFALPPAFAAEEPDRDPKEANAPAAEEPAAKPDHDRRALERRGDDDLTSCRRDADGMRGPERSRFMTRCLKERK